ncbi:SpaA isopeptide-forming pilin-related protein, partial [Lachnospiraceae bacterium 62-35]
MNARRKSKRIFCASILFLMVMLALGTAAFADDDANSPYSLIIKKVLTADSPAEAFSRVYKFRVVGQTRTGGELKTVTKDVEIIGEGQAKVGFEGPTAISVVELTNEMDTIGDWTWAGNDCESFMFVPGRTADLSLSKPNGKITIEKPLEYSTGADGSQDSKDPKLYTYRITGADGESWTKKIWNGERVTLDSLSQGKYTVEELKAPDGFNLKVDNSEVNVAAGEEGSVRIRGDAGKITIKGPGTLGDGRVHHFTFTGPNREERLDIKSGEDYVLDHLAEGTYTIKEYEYNTVDGYTVTTPKSDETQEKGGTYTTPGYYKTYKPSMSNVKDGDYIKVRVQNIKGPAEGSLLKVQIKGKFLGDNEETVKNPKLTDSFKSTYMYTLGSAYFLEPGEFKLAFLTKYNVTSSDVSWFLCRPRIAQYTSKNGEKKTVAVDYRGWLEIKKKEDTSSPPEVLDKVIYRYKITGPKDFATEVDLKAGETKRIEGLSAGNYTVERVTIETPQSVGFSMAVEDAKAVTSIDQSLIGTMMEGKNALTLTKPQGEDGGRVYYFTIIGENGFEQEIELKAGESKTWENLTPGDYILQEHDSRDTGYNLTFSDSSTVTVLGSSNAQVAFTNKFMKKEGYYKVVHEYYLEHGDGSLELEDQSEISTVGAKLDDDHWYTADGVGKIYFASNGLRYSYFEAGYGKMKGSWENVATPSEISVQEEDTVRKNLINAGSVNDNESKNDDIEVPIVDDRDKLPEADRNQTADNAGGGLWGDRNQLTEDGESKAPADTSQSSGNDGDKLQMEETVRPDVDEGKEPSGNDTAVSIGAVHEPESGNPFIDDSDVEKKEDTDELKKEMANTSAAQNDGQIFSLHFTPHKGMMYTYMSPANEGLSSAIEAGNGGSSEQKNPEDSTGEDVKDTEIKDSENDGSKAPEGGDIKEPEGGESKAPEGGDTKEPEADGSKAPEGGDIKEPEGGESKEPEDDESKAP